MINVIKDAIVKDVSESGRDIRLDSEYNTDTDQTTYIVTITEPTVYYKSLSTIDITEAYIDAYKQYAKSRSSDADLNQSKDDEKFYTVLKTLCQSLLNGTNNTNPYHGSSEYELTFGWKLKELMNSVVFQVDKRILKYNMPT